jgi:hypothetical protein
LSEIVQSLDWIGSSRSRIGERARCSHEKSPFCPKLELLETLVFHKKFSKKIVRPAAIAVPAER